MFPEYRELISELKTTNRYFLNLFEKHNALDQKIKNIESRLEPGSHDEIETLNLNPAVTLSSQAVQEGAMAAMDR